MFIAENFMTGYRVVFDREKLTLGWKKFDCKCLYSSHSNCTPIYWLQSEINNHTSELLCKGKKESHFELLNRL